MKIFLSIYFLSLWFFTGFLFQKKTKSESIKLGLEIYQDFCVQCHLTSGEGVSGVFPPLKNSDYLFNNIDISIAGIKYGLKGQINVNDENYNGVMSSQGLDNEEIADVMNYILNQWGNNYEKFIVSEQVAKIPKTILGK
jgi:mono/diheme cytochrome c family protein